ncbi:MAG TPA: nuclear transport factor 2 family protein [Noviherbaspirillum sp.]|jgi:hypothetical protein|uniref:nuclear transport factor 2 family protein n=1 Tax=Noviherbaspirillum sp. TaxID=1926288 RepID=UPI002DDCAB37|nr:nuclear transport factor 2 family protein [Noviherbaspirillum sp.]HEV2611770.1 nuclear transport factor 2 family protein [Noviherbaspirillum sp.]
MTSEENKQLAKQAYASFMAGDIAKLMEIYADDIEWISLESEYVPFSGTYHGKAEVAQFFQKLSDSQDAERFEPIEYLADGDKVVVYGNSTWRVKSTGRTYDTPWVHISTMRDGKVIRFQDYTNSAAVEAAFMPTDSVSPQKGAVTHH